MTSRMGTGKSVTFFTVCVIVILTHLSTNFSSYSTVYIFLYTVKKEKVSDIPARTIA